MLEEAVALLAVDTTPEVDAVWFVPNDPVASMHIHLALARFMAGDTAGADAQLVRCAASARPASRSPGALEPAPTADWLSVVDRRPSAAIFASARALIADDVVELATRHGFDGWTLIGMTHRAAVDRPRSRCPAEATPDAVRAHAESRWPRSSRCGR